MTDHNALAGLLKIKNPTPRKNRWILRPRHRGKIGYGPEPVRYYNVKKFVPLISIFLLRQRGETAVARSGNVVKK